MIIKDSSKLKNISKAAEILKSGGVVIFPTDTIYGIGCRYDNEESVSKIRKIKGTPEDQNFPILISDIKQIQSITRINSKAKGLMSRFWPGALTIILESKMGDKKIGVRLPNSQITKVLIEEVGVPIIGTSANFHGDNSPTKFEDLDPEFAKLADYIIKGECGLGIESTVVDASGSDIRILRKGALRLPSG